PGPRRGRPRQRRLTGPDCDSKNRPQPSAPMPAPSGRYSRDDLKRAQKAAVSYLQSLGMTRQEIASEAGVSRALIDKVMSEAEDYRLTTEPHETLRALTGAHGLDF